MNMGQIAELFIRGAEVERASREHVGPSSKTGFWPRYVHTFADKAGWRKEAGDKLERGADPLAEERKAFWERMGMMPTAQEIRQLDGLYDMLMLVHNDGERRALLAWARSKVGGKSFRRWCFGVENIHPNTGRARKDRALTRISAQLVRNGVQNNDSGRSPPLHNGAKIDHVLDTLEEDAGKRDGLNNWAADDALIADLPEVRNFDWARKRNERRRQLAARKRKAEKAA